MENMKWDMDILYKGYEDPKYAEDVLKVKEYLEEIKTKAEALDGDELTNVLSYISLEEKLDYVLSDLFNYSSLRMSTDVNDIKANEEITKLSMMLQDVVPYQVMMDEYLKKLDIKALEEKSDVIKAHAFYLENKIEAAKHQLSKEEETIISKLSIVGSDSWGELQSKLTSNLSIKVKGVKDKMPLSQVRNLAYSNDKDLRKKAYKAEIKSYKQIEDSVAMALNNIKREVNILNPLRGYNSALEHTLIQSHMKRETLDAMISAINDSLPELRRYFYLKAEALGYKKGLPFYELFAPMGHLTRTYSYKEATDLVLEVYGSFSVELKNMASRAFSENWIDVLPYSGKVGGAFCASLANQGVSRVLTNFTGSLGDVQTLAHELGHAYHGQVSLKNSILNRNYPMELAETASILCQTMMAKKMINDLDDPKEKLTVVEESLQEDIQCVVDILSRFLFESKVLDTPVYKPLSSDELCKMMLDCQDASYGDGLNKKYRHPYMWLCKSHYYSAGLNFYNWPYTFGLLYGKGLYKEYLKDNDLFVKNYDTMLQNTSLMNVEEVASTMNIDVTKKEFWKESLDSIISDIDLFEELLKKNKLIK